MASKGRQNFSVTRNMLTHTRKIYCPVCTLVISLLCVDCHNMLTERKVSLFSIQRSNITINHAVTNSTPFHFTEFAITCAHNAVRTIGVNSSTSDMER